MDRLTIILPIVLILSAAVRGQTETKLGFNERISGSISHLDHLDTEGKYIACTTEDDFFVYATDELKQILHINKDHTFEDLSYLDNFLFAGMEGRKIIIRDLRKNAVTDTIVVPNKESSINFAWDKEKGGLAVSSFSHMFLYDLSKKKFTSDSFYLETYSIQRCYPIRNSPFLLIWYTDYSDDSTKIGIFNWKGKCLNSMLFPEDLKFYYNDQNSTFFLYNSVSLQRFSIASGSGPVHFVPQQKVHPSFEIRNIFDADKNDRVLMEIQPHLDSLFGKPVEQDRDTVIRARKRRIHANKFWKGASFVYDLSRNTIIDSIGLSKDVLFERQSDKVILIQQSESIDLTDDTISLKRYDPGTRQTTTVPVTDISPILAFDCLPQNGLVTCFSQDKRVTVLNCRNNYHSWTTLTIPGLDTTASAYDLVWTIKFADSGKRIVLFCDQVFIVLNTADLSVLWMSPTETRYGNSYKKVWLSADSRTVFADYTQALFKYDTEHNTMVYLYKKSQQDSLFRTVSAECIMLNDSLLLIMGNTKYRSRSETIRIKKQKKITIPDSFDRIRVYNINNRQQVFEWFTGNSIYYDHLPVPDVTKLPDSAKVEQNQIVYIDPDTIHKKLIIYCDLEPNVCFDYSDPARFKSVPIDSVGNFTPSAVRHSIQYRYEIGEDGRLTLNGRSRPAVNLTLPNTSVTEPDLSDYRTGYEGPLSSAGNDFICVLDKDKYLKFFDAATGKNVLNLVLFTKEGWLLYTPEGRFDLDYSLLPKLFWYETDTYDHMPFDYLYNSFFDPGLLSKAYFRERSETGMNISSFLRIPGLRLLLGKGLEEKSVNGANYAIFHEEDALARFNLEQAIVDAHLEKVNSNDLNTIKIRLPDSIHLERRPPAHIKPENLDVVNPDSSKKGVLYVASVGIGKYKKLPLTGIYASIAKFNGLFKENHDRLAKQFTEIYPFPPLLDDSATRKNVYRYLDTILDKVKQNDVLCLYLTGHGMVPSKSEVFFFQPFDVDMSSPENEANSSISAALLVDFIRYLRCRKIILIIDACYSGGSLESLQKITGVKNGNTFIGTDDKTGASSIYCIASAKPYTVVAQSGTEGSTLIKTMEGSLNRLAGTKTAVTVEDWLARLIADAPKTEHIFTTSSPYTFFLMPVSK
ncbi:MAG TPA: hypothetical protein VGN00_13110 [Puia sp.]|jgi:hypothetical protein